MQALKNISYKVLCTLILLMCSDFYSLAKTEQSREFQVKAVFLFNFTQFVDWPPASFTSSHSNIVIGILGTDPFGSYLEQTIEGEKANGHPLVIRHFTSTDDIGACHVLFINVQDKKKLQQAIASLKGKNILTVSDDAAILPSGGMVHFIIKNDKIQLQVNLEAVKAANLTMSSKLLRLVEIYEPEK
ncbi:YfiR family protein [Ferruginibacter albus]|uniref:YfiR family protein n=1 Tax=Ferruginibacter albus TaxID=2875540 RepID=UPI001CC66F20|nr:YfiR family protein [Ferruginibacter albus]UAY51543.1 YfiR family protein [Ferruginibacter albus]